jgi:hypothetical protein
LILLALDLDDSGCRGVEALDLNHRIQVEKNRGGREFVIHDDGHRLPLPAGHEPVITGMWIARARKTKKKNIQYLYIKYIKKNHANIPSVSTRDKAGLFPITSTRHILSHGAKKKVSTRIMEGCQEHPG